MSRQDIEARLEWLKQAQAQQQGRLDAARAEERAAVESLARVEGARQDCHWWLEQIAEAEAAHAQTNGAAEPALSH